MPQWNCRCHNCELARADQIPRRTQSSVAISVDGKVWFLVNASPDLPAQVEAFAPLHPDGPAVRHSPIAAVFLTNADLDHALGLLLMRQRDEPQLVFVSRDVHRQAQWAEALLKPFGGVQWREAPLDFFQLTPGLDFRHVPVGPNSAFEFRDQETNKRFLIAPAVGQLSPDLQTALNWSDAILFDGTFWSEAELHRFRSTARSASAMGHVPVQQSLPVLRESRALLRLYSHINNTNPILDPASPERSQVNAAGIAVAEDGMEFEL